MLSEMNSPNGILISGINSNRSYSKANWRRKETFGKNTIFIVLHTFKKHQETLISSKFSMENQFIIFQLNVCSFSKRQNQIKLLIVLCQKNKCSYEMQTSGIFYCHIFMPQFNVTFFVNRVM